MTECCTPMPSYEELLKSEDEMRYEAGMYHSLYDLWERRANEYQGIILSLMDALKKVRSYNVDIAAGRINYRPHDHIEVIDRALTLSRPQVEK